MIGIFQRLLAGDHNVRREFKAARVFWRKFFKGKRRWTAEQFTEWFNIHQVSYNHAIGAENPSAKETFALTCLGTLYDEASGWEKNGKLAVKVAKAILASTMSLEILHYARKVVAIYHLDFEDDELRRIIQR
jgi:hypothetical protein